MKRIQLILGVLKFLRIIFHCVGFLRLRYDRSQGRYYQRISCCCNRNSPGVILFLLISLHAYMPLEWGEPDEGMDVPELIIPFDVWHFVRELCYDIGYILLLSCCLLKRSQLWLIIERAQLIYLELRYQIVWKCSPRLFIVGVAQLLLMLALSFKLFVFHYPNETHPDEYRIIDYLMGLVRLLFALLLSLQIFYHLLHAALLQSLQNTCKLKSLLHLQPVLKRIQHAAASYFGASFCCFFVLLCFRCSKFFVFSVYFDENELLQRLWTEEQAEDEAENMGVVVQPTRSEQWNAEALLLAWHVALMWLLLYAAQLQQREYKTLLKSIWQKDFTSANKANPSCKSKGNSKQRACKDILSLLLKSRVSILDYRFDSINFVAWKSNSKSMIKLDVVAGCFKMLLKIVLCCAVVDYVQQNEIMHLLKQSQREGVSN